MEPAATTEPGSCAERTHHWGIRRLLFLLAPGWVVLGVAANSVVYLSVRRTWYSPPWPGSYEFYGGEASALGVRGYPIQIVVRSIIVVAIFGTLGIVAAAVVRLMLERRASVARRLLRIVLGLEFVNLVLVLSTVPFRPRTMAAFPPIRLVPGFYSGAIAAASGVLAAGSLWLAVDLIPLPAPTAGVEPAS